MPLKIVRGDITKLNTEVIADISGEAFEGDAEKLRSFYRNNLELAKEHGTGSIAFPLTSTGSYGFPRTFVLRIAIDEINSFLSSDDMDIYIVIVDTVYTEFAKKLHSRIQAFNANEHKRFFGAGMMASVAAFRVSGAAPMASKKSAAFKMDEAECALDYVEPVDEDKLDERLKHLKDPFGVYLLYLSDRKNIPLTVLENTAWLSKHIVYKVKKSPDTYRPDKRTAFQLAVGLELNLDDTKDLLSRAGYTISDSILEDKIWEFYIENEHFDIMDISDSLEKYGLKPIIDF